MARHEGFMGCGQGTARYSRKWVGEGATRSGEDRVGEMSQRGDVMGGLEWSRKESGRGDTPGLAPQL